MNKIQWIVLGIAFFLLGMLFASLSMEAGGNCSKNPFGGYNTTPPTENIFCIRQQVFAPFPYIFFSLMIVCVICAFLEFKKKHLKQELNKNV